MLTRAQEETLRLLVDDPCSPRIDLNDIDWAELRPVAASSGVRRALLRERSAVPA